MAQRAHGRFIRGRLAMLGPLFFAFVSRRLRQKDDTPGRDIAGGHRGHCQGQQFLYHDLNFNSYLDGSRQFTVTGKLQQCQCHWLRSLPVLPQPERLGP
jgi:hypothetical protein